jgi:murein DD-endopeptidase MepM/ murein hydrolase activator NlpD
VGLEILVEGFNPGSQPVTAAVSARADGVQAVFEPLLVRVVEPGERFQVIRLTKPATTNVQWSYSWRYFWHIDVATAAHDETARYVLPFKPGTRHRVMQGYNGAFSHGGALRHSIDFDMPEGTEVLAARAGTVIATRADMAGPGGGSGNLVIVRHSDGTFAHYQHLRRNGVAVSARQTVTAGELLGYSGNTGRSTAPHLHFHVSAPTPSGPGAFITFPTIFVTATGEITDPLKDAILEALDAPVTVSQK